MFSPSEVRVTGSSSKNGAGTDKHHVDGKALAIQLGATLLELGLTLAASYYFSRWLTRKLGEGNSNLTDDLDGGVVTSAGGSDGVINRLKKMLVTRHDAKLNALAEELEEHRNTWGEEEPGSSDEGEDKKYEDSDEEIFLKKQKPEKEYINLANRATLQHQQSLSSLSSLTAYELSIAQSNVIDPSSIPVKFSDIGGLDDIKSEIYDLVVVPLLRPDLFHSPSGLVSPPKGILLYGPPGTGKTMLAKAIAKESHATFVNVQLSTIMNKWFGESNKLISATFGLARKLAPSVVFIDEMDAFLSQRDGTEGSAVNSMKSEFLTLWDGLLSEQKSVNANKMVVDGNSMEEVFIDGSDDAMSLPPPPIIVLGATNRPYDVDPAILRRLPRSFEIALPNYNSRLQLLNLFLEKQEMDAEAKAFISVVANKTEGYSGSDLKELCKAAAWEPIRELTSGASRRAVGCSDNTNDETNITDSLPSGRLLKRTSSGFPLRGTKARPVSKNDFLIALQKVKRTGESARQFHTKEYLRGRDDRAKTSADISRAVNSGRNGQGDSGNIGKGTKSSKSSGDSSRMKSQPSPSPRQHLVDLTSPLAIQQMMAIALAAASSMKGNAAGLDALDFRHFGSSSGRDSDDEAGDDCAPPEIDRDGVLG
ncbi:hypothetical protein ACHAXS_000921 [Conticribra weissflogii]